VPGELVSALPQWFFEPQISAAGTFSGWLGVYLDTTGENSVDWNEIAGVLEDAFRIVAPKKLIAKINDR
jgi:hypothetical protein